jgi:hypothetical protein
MVLVKSLIVARGKEWTNCRPPPSSMAVTTPSSSPADHTSKNRGMRMIALHTDLKSLIKEAVTLGDAEAKGLQKKIGSKAAAPIFENVIELKSSRLNEWHEIPAGKEIRV